MTICSHCLLSLCDDQEIIFDNRGYCNYCVDYENKYILNKRSKTDNEELLNNIVNDVKASGKGNKYDCIMGLSGGVDSSYLAWIVKQLGLRPLIVHFDNGWNSELAVKNIENIINYTGFDLYTYVVDWDEFKDLQLAYIKASVVDWEIPTDHGFFALLHHVANKHNIRYIFTGHNYQTESIMPKPFRWSKMDVANIKDIHRKFGMVKLKTMPLLGFWRYNWMLKVKKIKRINILEYVEYDKNAAKALITEKFNWRDYGGKHYESIFTRFYQGYVLIKKFNIDKRKAHLSNLICSGQISRERALEELSKPAYEEPQMREDKDYVIKKLGLTHEEFESYMNAPPVSHLKFKSYETGVYLKHQKWMKIFKKIKDIFK